MVNTASNKLTKLFAIAALSMGALAACKDSASDNASDRNPSITSDSASAVSGTSGYNKEKAPASASTAARKKGKASVAMSDMSGVSGTGNTSSSEKMVMDKEGVYNKATVMPEFPGGQGGLVTYVNNHVDYPQQAIDDNTAGTVRVSFVVDETGKVKNAKVVGGQVGGGLDQEALRVVNNMPNWKPGKVKGHNVKTRLELPINFQLEA